MLNREEARQIIQEIYNSKIDGYTNLLAEDKEIPIMLIIDIEALNTAIEALEKQIPQKVIRHDGNYSCPACSKPAMAVSARKKKYCDFCGQDIDWSDSDD